MIFTAVNRGGYVADTVANLLDSI